MDPLEHTQPLPITPSTLLFAGATLAVALVISSATVPSLRQRQARLLRWLQRKHYQYEVTFSLYMMTPTEKFVLNSFLFLALSLLLIAASLYLPSHIVTMSRRAFYYYSGYGGHHGGAHAGSAATKGFGTVVGSAKGVGEAVAQAARETAG